MKNLAELDLILEQFDIRPNDTVATLTAHPDDEAVFLGGAIKRFRTSGIRVVAITASFGEASTKGDREYVANGGRREELDNSYDALEIPQDNRHRRYLELSDGTLSQRGQQELLTDSTRQIIRDEGIRHLFTVDGGGFGHFDHVATAITAVELGMDPDLQLNAWWLNSLGQGGVSVPVDPVWKTGLVGNHPSQFPLWPARDALEAPSVTHSWHGYLLAPRTREELRPYEHLFEVETYDRVTPEFAQNIGQIAVPKERVLQVA